MHDGLLSGEERNKQKSITNGPSDDMLQSQNTYSELVSKERRGLGEEGERDTRAHAPQNSNM